MILHRFPRKKQSTEALQFAGFMFVSVEKPPNTVPHVGTLGGNIGISSFGTQADSWGPSSIIPRYLNTALLNVTKQQRKGLPQSHGCRVAENASFRNETFDLQLASCGRWRGLICIGNQGSPQARPCILRSSHTVNSSGIVPPDSSQLAFTRCAASCGNTKSRTVVH